MSDTLQTKMVRGVNVGLVDLWEKHKYSFDRNTREAIEMDVSRPPTPFSQPKRVTTGKWHTGLSK